MANAVIVQTDNARESAPPRPAFPQGLLMSYQR
jgi:hypothetical protein